MNDLKISAYGYLFNARKFDFDAEETIANFCEFFDEVICATVPSEDDTLEILKKAEKKYKSFKVVETNVKILGNNRFDGQLKTIAMKNCTNDLLCIVDFDEFFPISNKPKWLPYCEYLLNNHQIDGLLIPSVDCFGNKETIRADVHIGQKFRLHKKTVFERGVPNFAEAGSGLFLTSKSDSTDPLDKFGNLSVFQPIVQPTALYPIFAKNLVGFPYVLHYGSVNLQRRAKIGKEFWEKAWSERSGMKENVITDVKKFDNVQTIKHYLPLE